jgi:hypothetical protein
MEGGHLSDPFPCSRNHGSSPEHVRPAEADARAGEQARSEAAHGAGRPAAAQTQSREIGGGAEQGAQWRAATREAEQGRRRRAEHGTQRQRRAV